MLVLVPGFVESGRVNKSPGSRFAMLVWLMENGGGTSLITGGWGSNSGATQSRVVGSWNNASASLTALALKPTRPIVVVSDEKRCSISIEYETCPTSRNTSSTLGYFLITSNPPYTTPSLPYCALSDQRRIVATPTAQCRTPGQLWFDHHLKTPNYLPSKTPSS